MRSVQIISAISFCFLTSCSPKSEQDMSFYKDVMLNGEIVNSVKSGVFLESQVKYQKELYLCVSQRRYSRCRKY